MQLQPGSLFLSYSISRSVVSIRSSVSPLEARTPQGHALASAIVGSLPGPLCPAMAPKTGLFLPAQSLGNTGTRCIQPLPASRNCQGSLREPARLIDPRVNLSGGGGGGGGGGQTTD